MSKIQRISILIRWHWRIPMFWLSLQMVPPFSSNGYTLSEIPALNQYVITHPIKSDIYLYQPVFQIIPLLLITGLFLSRGKITRLLYIYAAIMFSMIAILQSVSIGSRWGLAICTGNFLTFAFLAYLWAREAFHLTFNLNIRECDVRLYWLFLPALIAFWEPVNRQTLLPEFNPLYLLTSSSGLSFCLSTPLYLVVLNLVFPKVNKTLFLSLAFVGFYLAVGNLLLEFFLVPAYWWIGVLHFPLLALSLLSLYRFSRSNNDIP